MADPGFIDVLVRFFTVLLSTAVLLPFTLMLVGYDIWGNRRITFLLVMLESTLWTFTFYLPQALRAVLNELILFAGFKWGLGLRIARSFAALIVFHIVVTLPADLIAWIVFLYAFHISPAEFYTSHTLQLLYPWTFVPVYVLLIYIGYRRGWCIFREVSHFKLKAGLLAIPFVQLLLLYIVIAEDMGNPHFRMDAASPVAIAYILVALAIAVSLYSLWRTFQYAGREAFIQAQEKAALEMEDRVNAIRAQRHDFINHIQILLALLQENRIPEMRDYLKSFRFETEAPPN